MDELAHAAGIDPVELRKRNIPEDRPRERQAVLVAPFRRLAGSRVPSTSAGPTARRATAREGEWLIGTGMASAVRVNMLMEVESAGDAGRGWLRHGRNRHDRYRAPAPMPS